MAKKTTNKGDSNKQTSKTEQIKAQREAQAERKADATVLVEQGQAGKPGEEIPAETKPASPAPTETGNAAALPSSVKISSSGKKYYKWSGLLGQVAHRMIILRREMVERLDKLVAEAADWQYPETAAAIKDELDVAHKQMREASALLSSAANTFEKHREFKPGVPRAAAGTSKIAVGASVQIRERYREDYADVLDAASMASLTVKSLAKNKAVCTTSSGERVIVPLKQIAPAAAASPTS